MIRVEVLLRLYRVALAAPEDGHVLRVEAWVAQRQRLLDELAQAPAGAETSIERALLALIVHADRGTHQHLLKGQQRARGQLRQRRY